MKEAYKNECRTIVENSTYNAETHHIIADKKKRLSTSFQIIPAISTAITGTIALADYWPTVFGFLTVITAIITAISNILDPKKAYQNHLNAAKNFTTIKNDARALCDVFSLKLDEAEFTLRVEEIHRHYNGLVQVAPPTDNKSFEEARKRIKSGIHEPDFKDNV